MNIAAMESASGVEGGFWFTHHANGDGALTRLGLDAQEQFTVDLGGVPSGVAAMPDGGAVVAWNSAGDDRVVRVDPAGAVLWDTSTPGLSLGEVATSTSGFVWVAGLDEDPSPAGASPVRLLGVTP